MNALETTGRGQQMSSPPSGGHDERSLRLVTKVLATETFEGARKHLNADDKERNSLMD